MLRHKMSMSLPQVAKQPQLLSHFIHELMNFDVSLREDWGYDGGCGVDGWKGLTWEVLVKKEWFGRWLEVEKTCTYCWLIKRDGLTELVVALSRYQEIIEAPESGEIDYESVDPGATKPTNGAIRVNDLLETITGRDIFPCREAITTEPFYNRPLSAVDILLAKAALPYRNPDCHFRQIPLSSPFIP